jgi:hypothetical protein
MIGDLRKFLDKTLHFEPNAFLLARGNFVPYWTFKYCNAWDSLKNIEPTNISFNL